MKQDIFPTPDWSRFPTNPRPPHWGDQTRVLWSVELSCLFYCYTYYTIKLFYKRTINDEDTIKILASPYAKVHWGFMIGPFCISFSCIAAIVSSLLRYEACHFAGQSAVTFTCMLQFRVDVLSIWPTSPSIRSLSKTKGKHCVFLAVTSILSGVHTLSLDLFSALLP